MRMHVHEFDRVRPSRKRWKWLLSQQRWHDQAALATEEREVKRWAWHCMQAMWYERQIYRMWKLD